MSYEPKKNLPLAGRIADKGLGHGEKVCRSVLHGYMTDWLGYGLNAEMIKSVKNVLVFCL